MRSQSPKLYWRIKRDGKWTWKPAKVQRRFMLTRDGPWTNWVIDQGEE